jgi:hypothetical protein
MYVDIWTTKVPAKVLIFAWRLEQEGLATQVNRRMRKLEKEAKCQIYGKEDESGHHAVVRCTKALALRMEMRNHWRLPNKSQFQHAGPDWLHTLLSTLDKEATAKTLLLSLLEKRFMVTPRIFYSVS